MAETSFVDRSGHPADPPPGLVDFDLRSTIVRTFPWLQLGRALPMSLGLGKFVLAILGILLLKLASASLSYGLSDTGAIRTDLDSVRTAVLSPNNGPPTFWSGFSSTLKPLEDLLYPLSVLLHETHYTRNSVSAALRVAICLIIWGILGGAIARISLIQAGQGHGTSIKSALRYATRNWKPLLGTPFLPILVIALCYPPMMAFGLIPLIPGVGQTLGQVLLIIPLLFGFLMFVMVAGLTLGWPLMVVSAAAQGEDSLDALSRSFSYLNNRLFRYLFYVVIVWLISIPGLYLMTWVSEGTLLLTRWGLGAAMSPDTLDTVFSSHFTSNDAIVSGRVTSDSFWVGLVRLIPRAWAYSYFWTAFALIYLIIRKDVDGAEWSHLKAEASPVGTDNN